MDVAGKVVLVTGGGGGIGAGIAEAFAEAGARVVVTDVDLAHAQTVAERIGSGVVALAHDVTSRESWDEVKSATETAFGAVDVLCNNAGVSIPFQSLEDVTEDAFERLMAINVRGVFLGCKAFLPDMKRRGSGHIVNTSSVNGQIPHATSAAYSASKFAVSGLSEALGKELEPTGVGVSILYPGLTRSKMSTSQVADLPEAHRAAIAARMMEPVWLGRAVVRAVEDNRLHIITHPDHLETLQARLDQLVGAYGEPAQPGFAGGRIA